MIDSSDVALTLSWIENRLPFFDPLPSGKVDYAKLKAFGELSILHLYLSQSQAKLPVRCRPAVSGFLRCCSAFLCSVCDRTLYIEAVHKDPLQGYAYVLPYFTLRSLGTYLPGHERLLAWLDQFGLPLSIEAIPYREWDRQLALWKAGLRAQVPSSGEYYPLTCLALRKGSLYMDMEEAYAVTHTIFYMTDFGLRTADLSAEELARVGVLLRSLLVDNLCRENWDLACELLMCMYQLEMKEDKLMLEAAAVFEEIRREDGSMPASGRKFRRPRPRGQKNPSGRSKEDRYTLGCYHPTFVWLLYAISSPQRVCHD